MSNLATTTTADGTILAVRDDETEAVILHKLTVDDAKFLVTVAGEVFAAEARRRSAKPPRRRKPKADQ